MRIISYTLKDFFRLFSDGKRILIFLAGDFVSLTEAKFTALGNVEFQYLGVEHRKEGDKIIRVRSC